MAMRNRVRCRGDRVMGCYRHILPLLVLMLLCMDCCCRAQVYNLSLAVDEGLPPGTLVGDIRAGLPEGSPGEGFFLSEESGESPVLRDFQIDTDTGIVRTLRILDRERRERYSFVAATLLGEVVQVEITVRDVNDHSPTFPVQSLSLQVSELTPPGTTFRLPAAWDPDKGEHGLRGYSLLRGSQEAAFIIRYGDSMSGAGAAGKEWGQVAEQVRGERGFYRPKATLEVLKEKDQSSQEHVQDESAEFRTTGKGLGSDIEGSWIRGGELLSFDNSKEENKDSERGQQWESGIEDAEGGFNGEDLKSTVLGHDTYPGGYVYEVYPDTRGNTDSSDLQEEVEWSFTDSRLNPLDLVLVHWLDREAIDKYQLEVEAFDGGYPRRTGRLLVNITVLDANDNPPNFDQSEYKGWVWENAPAGTSICAVHAVDPDLGSNGEVIYSLWSGEEYFSVEESTGIVRVSRPLDREQKALHQLVVQAKDGGSQPEVSSVLVMVNVLDVNDNKPSIQITLLTESGQPEVSEGARIGEYLARISISDPDLELEGEPWETSSDKGNGSRVGKFQDSRENVGVVGHSLAKIPPVVNISQSENPLNVAEERQHFNPGSTGAPQQVSLTLEGADGAFSLRPVGPQVYFLCVDAPLDREQKDLYELRLLASDSGSPPLQTLKTLFFSITDLNDQPPMFNQPNGYQAAVSESASPGTAVLSINAQDLDEDGLNARIIYTLQSSDSSTAFKLDPHTGVLSITRSLDYETETVMNLVVIATDQGNPPLSSSCHVTIMVEDTNDNEPVFLQQFYNATLQEHSALGHCFLQVKATDADSGSFGQVHYSLYEKYHTLKESQKFFIDRDSGHICVSQDIDREGDVESYELLVKAQDQGGLSAQAFVRVDIEDINDNAPEFETTNYVASTSSHTQAGTEVVNVLAEDKDGGIFGEVLYEIIPGEKTSLFTIDSSTGIIYLISALNHLEDSQVTFFVCARDQGGRTSSVNASITVKILKTAVAPAVFEKSRYVFVIAEDAPQGSTVGIVKAREPLNSMEPISYRILSGDLQKMFSINPQFGIISTAKQLDHETQPVVVLTVQSQLGSSPAYSSTLVNVTITDVNDNPPVFPRENDRISVQQNTSPGSALYIAQAQDSDSGYNGLISYSIASENQDVFVIDPNFGILYLNTTLTMVCEHILLITAEDNGHPFLSSLLTLTISVTKPDTINTLTFGNLAHQIEINEDFAVYSRILQVKAYIEGAQSQLSRIIYSLWPESSVPFAIHRNTGWIFLRRSLDYERTNVYNLIVVASCADFVEEQTASTSVIVKVMDVNDNSPAFSQTMYFFTTVESSSPNGVIGTITASDRDFGKNGQLSFSLLSEENYFQISSKTGEIINCAALDREKQTHHQFTVLVTDHGSPRRNATTTVYITVADLNDNKPYFPQLPLGKQLHVKVPEGQKGHMLVTTVFAKDPDAGGNGTVQYSLSSDEDLGNFFINTSTGEIWATQPFSVSLKPYYCLTVTARDQGVPPLKESATVNIQVISTTKEKSKGIVELKTLKIPEDAKPSQVVGSIVSREKFLSNKKIQLQISEEEHNSHFVIDGSSGDIYLSRPLDYETSPNYLLLINIQDHTKIPPQNHSVILKIDIEDQNDHSPVFPHPMVVIGFEENVPVGTVLYTFEAKDGDGNVPNNKVKYSLKTDGPGEYPFFIHEWDGSLITDKELDREAVESYVFTVIATDQAANITQRRHSSLTAQIIIQDVNDNSPNFLSSPAAFVMEDAEVGSLIHHVVAEDPDEGRNGKITFYIMDGNSEQVFLLDQTTGWLTLSSTVDREIRETYILTILATDNGTPVLSATQILTVTVGDVNDKPPTFKQAVYEAEVLENQEPGMHVMKVEAEDMDTGVNAILTYYILPSHELFRIIPETGEIVTSATFDREKKDRFIIRVLVTDGGTPSFSSSTTIVCTVLDENDNTPELLLPEAEIHVPENQAPGIIHNVLATDKDTGNNGRVHFQIIGGNTGGDFAINNTSGELWATRSLDREDVSNFTITVECYDLGSPRKSTTAKLHIKVLDENDNPPTFSKSQYRTSVREDITIGSVVLSLHAFDIDEGLNGEVMYSLIDDTQGAFTINQTTGNIETTKALDRELKHQYVFRALATDCSLYGQKSATAKVIVHIDDANDNEPILAINPMQVRVSPQLSVNTTIANVYASDPDLGLNGAVVYSLVKADPHFYINRETGEIKVIKLLSPVTFTNAVLKVEASDLGTPAKTSTGLVTVILEGMEINIYFLQSIYEAIILENSKPGSSVVTVEAIHQNPNGDAIFYSLISGDKGTFKINSETGELTVRESLLLDAEANMKMNLVVAATSSTSVAYCGVSVLIQDENDNVPVFDRDHHITSVLEGQGYNLFVIQVFATDEDSGMNGQIDYSFVDGNENQAFLVDFRWGIITTNAILDREIKSSYRLVVQAADRGSPSLSATSIVMVLVADINDNAPTIPPLETVYIHEDASPGHIVMCVTANDVDLKPNVSYSFTEDGNPGMKFDIDKYTGVLTLIGLLDYEEKSQHHLRIQASDSVHLTKAELIVQVLDVNDNPPQFTKDSYKVTVPELTESNTFIISVTATDRDSEMYGPVSYRIISPRKGFVINPTTGSIHTDTPVEIKDNNTVIPILVEAQDNGFPVLTSTVIIELQVYDTNNHAPIFSEEVYQIHVRENTSIGEIILTFTATDFDWTRENGYIDFSIASGNLQNMFIVESVGILSQPPFVVTGKLAINGILDYEINRNHKLLLIASDRGLPSLSSSTTVLISIIDSNDNPPLLQSSEYHVSIQEHHPIKSEVISVSANDIDSGENAEIIYSIVSGNDEGFFTIDPRNGTVTLVYHLDYEAAMIYTLIIKATDGWGNGKHDAFSKLYINVLDDNDFIPKFIFNSLSCSLYENMPPFTPVCRANAIDLDSGPFGVLSYSIPSTCPNEPKGQDTFFIDSLTGDIYTKYKVDFESQKRYCLIVQVKDKSESTACILLHVDINGQDEFPPVFHEDQYLFDLPLENKPGEIVGKVGASDKDEGDDGVVHYSLEKPSPFFSVNVTSGAIYLTRSVHKIRSNAKKNDDILELVVKAQSPKLDSKSSTCTVRVNISTALEGYFGMSANILSISFSISFVVFLLLAISLIGIILRYKHKDVVNACGIKEAAIPALPKSNVKDCMPDECPKFENVKNGITPDTSEWLGLVGIREKKDTGNKCRNSDSSGHGSTEGETAEDEEIKMINEYPIRKESGSVLSERGSRVPDSGIPRESDLLSCESDETDVVIGSERNESVEIVKEDNGNGEGQVHYTCKTELPPTHHSNDPNPKDKNTLPDINQDYIYVPMSYDSRYGSLASLVASDEDLRGSYNWDYLLSWEPRFQTLSSVFGDIGRLKDENMNRNVQKQKKPFIFPPPLITSVAQPGIRAVPPRMPTIMSGQTFVKYPRSPFFSSLACQSSVMPPNFSPSLSMLTVHTPSTSPVHSGLSGTSVPALSEELLIQQEFQV
ncbi:protocadherin-23 [Rana temporaria]|uniref:protocadherin-23 n=1 Tax=Rana temporaria TaxID=8407 RepID=UPI001AAD39FB|nr:protocadherin-23 [Rana temporaria]